MSYRWPLICIVLLNNAKEAKFDFTFTGELYNKLDETSDVLNFEDGFNDWEAVGVNITEYNEENEVGHYLEPEPPGLNGSGIHQIKKIFSIAPDSSLQILFQLYVEGYNASYETDNENLPPRNPKFELKFMDEDSGDTVTVMNLKRLNVQNDEWNVYDWRVKVEEAKNIWIIFVVETPEDSSIALDDVEIKWIPLPQTELENDHETALFPSATTTTTTTTLSTSSSSTTTTNTTSTSTISTTLEDTTTTTTTENTTKNSEAVSEEETESNMPTTTTTKITTTTTTTKITTTTTTEANTTSTTTAIPATNTNTTTTTNTSTTTTNSTEEGPDTTTTTTKSEETETTTESNATSSTTSSTETASTTSTSTPSTSSTENKNSTEASSTTTTTTTLKTTTVTESTEPVADAKTDTDSGSGYASQVILICLTVIFGCLFLFMVFKYQRLRTSIGDYRLQHGAGAQSRQTYDNPAFTGFGMQDSYNSR